MNGLAGELPAQIRAHVGVEVHGSRVRDSGRLLSARLLLRPSVRPCHPAERGATAEGDQKEDKTYVKTLYFK